ncbi:meiotically up-regulated gene family-domain-containing protein [Linnemannia elongata]|nr:meiotically up-regulated gene family-domain-containing protein [Linnemannia elongata]
MVKSITFFMVAIATVAGSVFGFFDTCNGSYRCNNEGMSITCKEAFNRFNDDTVYNSFTSLTNRDCAAIYQCIGDYPALTGRQIKDLFAPINAGQGCKGCGSHAFNGGSCRVTLNYCYSCLDSGNPN